MARTNQKKQQVALGEPPIQYNGYIPADTSGNDYAALSGMSDVHRAALDAATVSWNEANSRGDRAGMDAAHEKAENIRALYGYSGGVDGSEYIPVAQPKKQQTQTYSFSYQPAPTYVNRYQSLIDELRGKVLTQDPFSYDAESDPLFQQYRTSYTRSGQRAMQDTLGQMAARTGGMASSYAGSAAQQSYDGYMTALAGKVPELQQLAYEMYQDEGDKQRLNLEMISALEREDYGKYQDLLDQYNTDRSFAYTQHRDQIEDQRYEDETAYDRGIYADETAYNRGTYADERDYDRLLQRAKQLAEAGDFSGYLALGYTEEEVRRLQAAYLRQHPELAYQSAYAGAYRASSSAGGYTAPTAGFNPYAVGGFTTPVY